MSRFEVENNDVKGIEGLSVLKLKPVIQEEITGCGIAAVANILGKTYPQMQATANTMGIYADDKSL
ncbi:hypothetical protein [Psychrobacter frigidicola]|uniref:hypothetical protein n=1 Tax=Psychrobacter frigidicola TaxID=45611 RepID=UPI00191AEBE6|nr:hypothetical protein [Psychrobacter frigidicola]